MHNYVYTATREGQICYQTIVLYELNLLVATTSAHYGWPVFFLHNILWTGDVCFTSECAFSVHNSHICFQTTVLWYLTDRLINDTVIFRKLFFRCCLKICLELWSGECGFSTISSSSLWERSPTVVERDISRKVNWMLRADCMVSSVARPKSDAIFFL